MMQWTPGFARALDAVPTIRKKKTFVILFFFFSSLQEEELCFMMDSLAATVDPRSSRRKFSKPPVKLACLSWYAARFPKSSLVRTTKYGVLTNDLTKSRIANSL